MCAVVVGDMPYLYTHSPMHLNMNTMSTIATNCIIIVMLKSSEYNIIELDTVYLVLMLLVILKRECFHAKY